MCIDPENADDGEHWKVQIVIRRFFSPDFDPGFLNPDDQLINMCTQLEILDWP